MKASDAMSRHLPSYINMTLHMVVKMSCFLSVGGDRGFGGARAEVAVAELCVGAEILPY